MRRRKRPFYRMKSRFTAAAAFLLINALSFLLMPVATDISDKTDNQTPLILAGLLFWIPLIVGYISVFLANNARKQFIQRETGGEVKMGGHCGLITFFSNLPAKIADYTMIGAVAVLLVIGLLGKINGYLTFVVISVLVFSVNMHSMFNGRIYKTIKTKQ